MKKRISWLGLSFLLVMALALTSCGEAVPGEQEEEEEEIAPTTLPAGMGTIEVRVTDAPGNVTAIEVTVSKVEVHKEVAGEGAWTSLTITGASTFDLIKIRDKEQELVTQDIDAARYTQIRMTVDMVEVTYLEDGVPTTKEATIPSGELKFVRPFDVVEGGTTTLIIDFDADKSVVFAGADKVIFKPVVKLSIEHGEEEEEEEEEEEDTTPPVITLTGVTEGQVIVSPDTATPVFSISDDTDPAPTVTATLNGDPFTSGTVVSAVDEYELEVTATDASGNEAEVKINFEIVAE